MAAPCRQTNKIEGEDAGALIKRKILEPVERPAFSRVRSSATGQHLQYGICGVQSRARYTQDVEL
jgi:hypothetical protein